MPKKAKESNIQWPHRIRPRAISSTTLKSPRAVRIDSRLMTLLCTSCIYAYVVLQERVHHLIRNRNAGTSVLVDLSDSSSRWIRQEHLPRGLDIFLMGGCSHAFFWWPDTPSSSQKTLQGAREKQFTACSPFLTPLLSALSLFPKGYMVG